MDDHEDDSLCEDCRCIDFEEIFDPDWKTAFGNKNTTFSLANLADIKSRKTCKFCRFITTCLNNCPDIPAQLREDYLAGVSVTLGEDESIEESHESPRWGVRFRAETSRRYSNDYELQIHRISNKRTPGSGRRVSSERFDVNILKKWLELTDLPSQQETSPISKPRLATLRLVDVVDQCIREMDARSRYFALSYIWGGQQAFRSLRSNKTLFETPGCFSDVKLPQTIRDAMDLVQQLGERYLYVDSLCIIQDDNKFKMAQVRAMDQIYNGAIAVIITTVGQDANAGLIGFRPGTRKWVQNKTKIGMVTIANCTGQFPLSTEISDCRWATRAWTHQEELLARRLIIFTSSQVVFSSDRHSDYLCEQIHDSDMDADPVESQLDRMYKDHTPFAVYAKVLETHSRRQISFSTDALNAFAGILAVLGPRLQTEFIFGLPCAYLTLALAWQSPTPPVPRRHYHTKEPIFPTWSWAGWVCEVVYHGIYLGTGAGQPFQSMINFVNPITKSPMPSAERDSKGLLREKAFEVSSFVKEGSELLRFQASSAKLWLSSKHKIQNVQGLTPWTPIFTKSGISAGKAYLNQLMLDNLETDCYEFIAISRTHANPHVGMLGEEAANPTKVIYSSTSDMTNSIDLEASITNHYPDWPSEGSGLAEVIALDAGFDYLQFEHREWCVLRVMLIVWKDSIAYRVGIGTCHADAFDEAGVVRKRIVLG